MAINPSTLYAGKINAPDANYIYGSARNITISGDGTGTPWIASIINDRFGFHQRLLTEAGIVPTGNPETILASQYFDSMAKIFGQTKDTIAACDTDAKIVVGSYIRTRSYLAGKNRGGSLYKVVAAATGTDDGGSFIDLTASGHQLQLIPENAWVSPYQWGAVGDKSVDDEDALTNCYTYAKNSSPKRWMYIEAGAYKIQSGLTWDGAVNVKGDGADKTIIHKDGNFTGITITMSDNEVGSFKLTSLSGTSIGGTDTANGIEVAGGSYVGYLYGITVTYQGNHGVKVSGFNSCTAMNWQTGYNGADGIRWEASGGTDILCSLNRADTFGNADNGFTIVTGNNRHGLFNMISCRSNGKHGFYCDGDYNNINVYSDNNDQDGGGVGAGTYRDIYFDTNSANNHVTILKITSAAGMFDIGTGNIVTNLSDTNSSISTQILQPRAEPSLFPTARSLTLKGGNGATEATTNLPGADIDISGGDAGTAGSGNANGGDVTINGGAKVNAGIAGHVYIQENDDTVVIGSNTGTSSYALLDLVSTTKAFILPRMTTTQRNTMVATNGMIIYNTTTNKFEGYENGSWTNLI